MGQGRFLRTQAPDPKPPLKFMAPCCSLPAALDGATGKRVPSRNESMTSNGRALTLPGPNLSPEPSITRQQGDTRHARAAPLQPHRNEPRHLSAPDADGGAD